MIEIKPSQLNNEINDLLRNTICDENTFFMAATDKDELLGVGVIKLYKDYAVLDDIIFKEEYKMLGLDYSMGKAMLNFIERRSVYDTYAHKSIDENLLTRLRFVENDDKITKNSKKSKKLMFSLFVAFFEKKLSYI